MAKEIELEQEEEAPRRGRPRKVTEDVIFGEDIDSDEEKRLREEREISQILEREDATTTTIIVSRRLIRTQKFAHLAEIGINDYNREELAKQYGGGEYRCRIRRSDGTFGMTWYFSVDASRRPELDPNSGGTATGLDAVRLVETVAAKLAPKEDQANVFAVMNQKNDQMMQMFMGMQQENTKLIAGMMTAMAQAFGSRPQTNDGALTQMSTMLLKHSLDQSQTRMDDMIGTIVKLKKLSEDGGKDEEPEQKGSFVQDIMFAIPQVLKSLQQPQQAAPIQDGQPQIATAAPVQATAPQVPPNLPLPKNVDPQMFVMVVMNLVSFAQADSDPADVHNSYEPMLTDEAYDSIAEFLEKEPMWFECIVAVVPQAAPHRKWFGELRDIILEEEEVEVPVATAPETADPDYAAAEKMLEEFTQGIPSNTPPAKPKAKKTKN